MMNRLDNRLIPDVSIVIPVHNRWDLTRRCLEAIREHTGEVTHEIVVVDNASTDEGATALPRIEGIRYHRNAANLGFAAASNIGAGLARGRHILFLNNDTEVMAGWLGSMRRMLESDPRIGAVGCLLLFPDGTVQHRGVYVAYADPYPITPFHVGHRKPPDPEDRASFLSAVTAACMLVRRQALEEVAGFDESYRNGNEDVDLCFAMRERGWLIGYTPEARVVHFESQTPERHKDSLANGDQLHRRWLGRFSAFDLDRRKKARRTFPDPARPRLTLVVSTCDSLATIAPCLEDAAQNLATGDQIVVADAGSRDSTLNFVGLFGLEHPGLVVTVRTPPGEGLAGAIREGVRSAAHEFVVVMPGAFGMADGCLDRLCTAASSTPAGLVPARVEGRIAIAGHAERVRSITEVDPGVLLQEDAEAVERLVHERPPALPLQVQSPIPASRRMHERLVP